MFPLAGKAGDDGHQFGDLDGLGDVGLEAGHKRATFGHTAISEDILWLVILIPLVRPDNARDRRAELVLQLTTCDR